MDTTQVKKKRTLRRPPRPTGSQELKPERVQEGLRAEEAEERLRSIPGWRLIRNGRAVRLAKELPTSEVAMLYSAYVAGFAGALSLPVAVSVSRSQVLVTLKAPHRLGRSTPVTESVLDLARRLG